MALTGASPYLRSACGRRGWQRSGQVREPQPQPPAEPMRKGSGSMEAGRMIAYLMTSASPAKEACHKTPLSADHSDSLWLHDRGNERQPMRSLPTTTQRQQMPSRQISYFRFILLIHLGRDLQSADLDEARHSILHTLGRQLPSSKIQFHCL